MGPALTTRQMTLRADGTYTVTETQTWEVRMSREDRQEACQMLIELTADGAGYTPGDYVHPRYYPVIERFGMHLDVIAEVSGYNAWQRHRKEKS